MLNLNQNHYPFTAFEEPQNILMPPARLILRVVTLPRRQHRSPMLLLPRSYILILRIQDRRPMVILNMKPTAQRTRARSPTQLTPNTESSLEQENLPIMKVK